MNIVPGFLHEKYLFKESLIAQTYAREFLEHTGEQFGDQIRDNVLSRLKI